MLAIICTQKNNCYVKQNIFKSIKFFYCYKNERKFSQGGRPPSSRKFMPIFGN